MWFGPLLHYVCVCVRADVFLSTQSSEGPRQKCSALIVCDFVKTLKGILPFNHGDGERDTHNEWGRARAKDGRR